MVGIRSLTVVCSGSVGLSMTCIGGLYVVSTRIVRHRVVCWSLNGLFAAFTPSAVRGVQVLACSLGVHGPAPLVR